MEPLKKKILKLELAGFFFTMVFGTLMHFGFELTGFSGGGAWFFPVNESPWEHLKLSYYPILIWGLIEYAALGKEIRRGRVRNFWFARLLGSYVAVLTVAISWSTQDALLGRSKLFIDISMMYFGLFAASMICWRLLLAGQIWSAESLSRWSIAGLGFFASSFALFTYAPPAHILWLDRKCQTYGSIQWHVLFNKDAAVACPDPASLMLLPGLAGFVPLVLLAGLFIFCWSLRKNSGPRP